MKILLIGSLPPPLGGTSLTLELLKNALESDSEIDLRVINTVGIRQNISVFPLRIIQLLIECVKNIRQADVVSLHIATTALPTVGLAIGVLCKALKKPYILRKFASTDYQSGSIKPYLNQCAIRLSTLFLVETQALVTLSQQRGFAHTRWFPTHRNPPLIVKKTCSEYAKRFVFVGHVREYKGINELIEASRKLQGGDIEIDIYGPLFTPFTKENIENEHIRYKGILQPSNVMPTLQNYDALILPTKAPTEGYPGAIVEALTVGIPVITTQCGAIPELVGEDCGIIIPPGQVEAIALAIRSLRFDTQKYQMIKKNVSNRSIGLTTGYWTEVFKSYCEQSKHL